MEVGSTSYLSQLDSRRKLLRDIPPTVQINRFSDNVSRTSGFALFLFHDNSDILTTQF